MVGPVGLVPNGIASRPALALSHLQSLRQTHFVGSTPLASLCSKSTSSRWWARWGSNPRPRDYESPALTAELQARLESC